MSSETAKYQQDLILQNKIKDTFLNNIKMDLNPITLEDSGIQLTGVYAISEDHKYFYIKLVLEKDNQKKVFHRHICSDDVYGGSPQKEIKTIYDGLKNEVFQKEIIFLSAMDDVLNNADYAKNIFSTYKSGGKIDIFDQEKEMVLIKIVDEDEEIGVDVSLYLNLYQASGKEPEEDKFENLKKKMSELVDDYDRCKKCKF